LESFSCTFSSSKIVLNTYTLNSQSNSSLILGREVWNDLSILQGIDTHISAYLLSQTHKSTHGKHRHTPTPQSPVHESHSVPGKHYYESTKACIGSSVHTYCGIIVCKRSSSSAAVDCSPKNPCDWIHVHIFESYRGAV
jgi:hypothetical protein